jgi:hypothetical protein
LAKKATKPQAANWYMVNKGLLSPNSLRKYNDKVVITNKSNEMLMGRMYFEYLPVVDGMRINEYSP